MNKQKTQSKKPRRSFNSFLRKSILFEGLFFVFFSLFSPSLQAQGKEQTIQGSCENYNLGVDEQGKVKNLSRGWPTTRVFQNQARIYQCPSRDCPTRQKLGFNTQEQRLILCLTKSVNLFWINLEKK